MKNSILVIFALALLGSACKKSEFLTDGDYFHLSNKGAKMPVWVKGNLDSDVFLITVHGGPGASGHEFPLSKGFEYLEKDYAIVYWDQRFSGMSQGDPDDSNITPELFIEDTEKLVELIRHKYNPSSMFMLGHSWGGQLSAGYLGRDNHDSLFKGWIDLNGAIYAELESQLMKEWIMERLPAKLADENADQEFWQFALDWYTANPNPENYSAHEPYIFVSSLGGDAYNWEQSQADNPTPYGQLIFSSMFSFGYYVNGLPDLSWADRIDFTPELNNIDIPVLLLWGELDGIVPTTVADYVYDNLATAPADKWKIFIEECAHGPHFDQPEKFYEHMRQFIETYK